VFEPGDKVVVYQHDGKEFRGVVVLTEVPTSGHKVDEKQVAKED
jgi:hypothetical protein